MKHAKNRAFSFFSSNALSPPINHTLYYTAFFVFCQAVGALKKFFRHKLFFSPPPLDKFQKMRYYIRKITAGSSPPKEEYLCIVNNAVKNLPSDSAKTRDSFPIATNAKRINFLNLTSRSPWSSPIGPKIKFCSQNTLRTTILYSLPATSKREKTPKKQSPAKLRRS